MRYRSELGDTAGGISAIFDSIGKAIGSITAGFKGTNTATTEAAATTVVTDPNQASQVTVDTGPNWLLIGGAAVAAYLLFIRK